MSDPLEEPAQILADGTAVDVIEMAGRALARQFTEVDDLDAGKS